MQSDDLTDDLQYLRFSQYLVHEAFIALVISYATMLVLVATIFEKRFGKWQWIVTLLQLAYVAIIGIPAMYASYIGTWHSATWAPFSAMMTVLISSILLFEMKRRVLLLYGFLEITTSLLGAWFTTRVKHASGYDALFVIGLLGSVYTGVRGVTNFSDARKARRRR